MRYVVLPDVELEYSAQGEAKLIRSRANPLRPVAFFRHATVYAVPDARTIVTGPGRADVMALKIKTVAITLSVPGRYRVSVRYSPYWRASHGCVSRSADGAIALVVSRPGSLTLTLDVEPRKILETLIGPADERCTSPN